jgi:hypothetical protein
VQTTILKKIRKTDAVYLRDAITVAFFLPPPIHASVAGLREAFELYLKAIPPGALTWSLVGASSESWSPVGKSTVSRCLAQLEPARARARPLTAFKLSDGLVGAEAPGYGVDIVGGPGGDPDLPDEKNLLQLSFPCEALDAETAESFVGFCREVAELVPHVSGYVSPVLQWAMLYRGEAMAEARALAIRHHGYDVHYNEVGRLRMGKRVRGARWLTFLGKDIAGALGGPAGLRAALSKAIDVEPLGAGVMIRAGKLPELGDVNKGIGVPLLREVAVVLEPVTAFHELCLYGNFAEHDDRYFERWERRLLD